MTVQKGILRAAIVRVVIITAGTASLPILCTFMFGSDQAWRLFPIELLAVLWFLHYRWLGAQAYRMHRDLGLLAASAADKAVDGASADYAFWQWMATEHFTRAKNVKGRGWPFT